MRNRSIEVVRAAWGAALLLAPRTTLEHLHHIPTDTRSLVVTRILGVRQLTQAALSGLSPSPEVLAMGVWVDSVHASSMVGLAVVDRSRARGGLTDAVVATGWAASGWHDLVQGRATAPRHDRRRDAMARWVLNRAPGGAPLAHQAARIRQETS